MKYWKFKGALQQNSWLTPAFATVDEHGCLLSLSNQAPADGTSEDVDGWLLPGFINAHSHAFQYAMAGLAEHLPAGAANDDFWSWREAMYGLALQITPEQMEAVASMLYAEMARFGYTAVVEFHYVHNDPTGVRYDNPAEMGLRLVSAAQRAGIDITLVPMYYNRGDFDAEPSERQRRFISKSLEEYYALFDAARSQTKTLDHANMGFGVHSLRAATPQDVVELFNNGPEELPFHVHVSEQTKEVERCLESSYGSRPIQWLLDNIALSERCHLVHATHSDSSEVSGIAQSGASVVLCPSTEGNLGDGFFPLLDYWAQDGRWSIGTDSHIALSLLEDLRILDYGQRLLKRKRNILCRKAGDDSGRLALLESIFGGRRAMGSNETTLFAVGAAFDGVVIDAQYPLFVSIPEERILSTLVYGSDASALLGTIKNGEWLVRNQQHQNRDEILADFIEALSALRSQL